MSKTGLTNTRDAFVATARRMRIPSPLRPSFSAAGIGGESAVENVVSTSGERQRDKKPAETRHKGQGGEGERRARLGEGKHDTTGHQKNTIDKEERRAKIASCGGIRRRRGTAVRLSVSLYRAAIGREEETRSREP